VFSAIDGAAQGTVNLSAAPLFDGMAAVGNRLYVSTQDGAVLCLEQGPVSVADRGTVAPQGPANRGPEAIPVVTVREWGVLQELTGPRTVRATPAGGAANACGVDHGGACPVYPTPQMAALATPPAPLLTETAPEPARSEAVEVAMRCSGMSEEELGYEQRSRDMTWHCELPFVKVVGVSASSCAGANEAANTIDCDLRSRWATRADSAQWLVYDLGRVRDVSAATIVCYTPGARSVGLSVELSTDGREYSVADRGTLLGTGSTCTTVRAFLPTAARYVRVRLEADNAAPPSVYEVAIHEPLSGLVD
jgi:hypothetical protein